MLKSSAVFVVDSVIVDRSSNKNQQATFPFATITESTTKTADDFSIYELLQKAKHQSTFSFIIYFRSPNQQTITPADYISSECNPSLNYL
jgi:hypothetical protein